jgi:hypothetical protein
MLQNMYIYQQGLYISRDRFYFTGRIQWNRYGLT